MRIPSYVTRHYDPLNIKFYVHDYRGGEHDACHKKICTHGGKLTAVYSEPCTCLLSTHKPRICTKVSIICLAMWDKITGYSYVWKVRLLLLECFLVNFMTVLHGLLMKSCHKIGPKTLYKPYLNSCPEWKI